MKKNATITRLAAVMLAAAMICLFVSGCAVPEERKQYDAGVDYYNNGEYEKAKECFQKANGYANTNEFLEAIAECESRYDEATAMMEEHRYPEALALFESIPKYLNSQEFIDSINELKTNYEEGLRLYEDSKYLEARDKFANANGYMLSDTYIENIDAMAELYNKGMEYKNNGDYENAIAAFQAINADFEGAYALIEECANMLLQSPIHVNTFIKNYNEEYADADISISAGDTSNNFTLSDSRGLLITGVANADGYITYISFWFSPELMSDLGGEGYNEAAAHCIHALNPYVDEYSNVASNVSDYLNGIANYGCMKINTMEDQSGSTVVEAAYEAA